MQWLVDLFNWYIPVGGGGLLVREVVGNVFGLASALGGMRRKVWALSLIHISEPTRLGMISYAVFCLKKKK